MIFQHDLENAHIRFFRGAPSGDDWIANEGTIKRRGFEVVAETMPFFNFSILTGLSFVRTKPIYQSDKSIDNHTLDVGIRYDDKKSFRAELFGHYINWDDEDPQSHYDDFIWDYNLSWNIFTAKGAEVELFLTAHNIFNGAQYSSADQKNPRRWYEGGLQLNF